MTLLEYMKLSSVASLLLGLLFGIIIILFVVISVLLIYSLLMVSVEHKTYENGVLRLIGLSKSNCIAMILLQGFTFVLPSLIFGYGASIPALMYIYKFMFKGADI
jgi:ABC-type antimicrobial peptide transport system permease subunit